MVPTTVRMAGGARGRARVGGRRSWAGGVFRRFAPSARNRHLEARRSAVELGSWELLASGASNGPRMGRLTRDRCIGCKARPRRPIRSIHGVRYVHQVQRTVPAAAARGPRGGGRGPRGGSPGPLGLAEARSRGRRRTPPGRGRSEVHATGRGPRKAGPSHRAPAGPDVAPERAIRPVRPDDRGRQHAGMARDDHRLRRLGTCATAQVQGTRVSPPGWGTSRTTWPAAGTARRRTRPGRPGWRH